MLKALVSSLALAMAAALWIGSALAQDEPAFGPSFEALANRIPDIAGTPLAEEELDPATGDLTQRTTTGLLFCKGGGGRALFTDGARTWIDGPFGLQDRSNDERFDWETVWLETGSVPGGWLPASPPSSFGAIAGAPGEAAGGVGLPRQIRIPAIGVDAEFEFVGLTADGAMDVPANADRIAWYSLGPRPGEPGNAVAAGHVDWEGRVRAFSRLRNLRPGDIVEVTTEDGTSFLFAVQWLRWYDAEGAPLEEIFGSSGVPEFTLITCGGTFVPQTRQYLSRLVVRAVLQ